MKMFYIAVPYIQEDLYCVDAESLEEAFNLVREGKVESYDYVGGDLHYDEMSCFDQKEI